MTASSDSDEHQAVRKNGIDQLQTKELRDLKEQSQRHHEEFVEFTRMDLGSHKVLDDGIKAIERKFGQYIFAGKVVWGLITLVSGTLLGGVGWLIGSVTALQTQTAEMRVSIEAIKEDIQDLQEELRDLRDLVQQHQINKREHLRPGHGKNGD